MTDPAVGSAVMRGLAVEQVGPGGILRVMCRLDIEASCR
jgi:hypothetical protein